MAKLKQTPTNTETINLLAKNEISNVSLKKNTPVVFAKILKMLMMINRITCLRTWPCLLRNAQFLPKVKLVIAPNKEPTDVAVT